MWNLLRGHYQWECQKILEAKNLLEIQRERRINRDELVEEGQ